MKDKLIDLAARWNTVNCNGMKPHECAAELLEILDAEGDGGAVGDLSVVRRYALAQCTEYASSGKSAHPARSGVVSDEDVRDAERYRWLLEQHNSEGRSWHVRLPNNGIPYLLNEAIDAAIQGERHER